MVDAWEKSELLFLRFGVVGELDAKGIWKDIVKRNKCSSCFYWPKPDQGVIDT